MLGQPQLDLPADLVVDLIPGVDPQRNTDADERQHDAAQQRPTAMRKGRENWVRPFTQSGVCVTDFNADLGKRKAPPLLSQRDGIASADCRSRQTAHLLAR